MALSIGIVGLPNVGKSTLFNALTDADALAANYPFATIEPNTGIVPIPDERLAKLAEIYKTDKIVPATVTFVDIAGLVAGASQGEGLGNQFLSHIRGTNAICQVVRAFDDSSVQNSGTSDPKKDIEIINTELILADIQTVNNRLPRLEKEVKANPKLHSSLDLLLRVKVGLDEGKLTGSFLNEEEREAIGDLQLLTAKPFIIVYNLSENQLANEKLRAELESVVSPAPTVFICAKLESELRGLDETDRKELLESYGQHESGLIQLIHAAYSALGLQSFLTAGEKEVRAWTIQKGAIAPRAAGIIHTDFERGFIAAQVVDYYDLIAAGSETAAKAAGNVRTEGKTYIMQPDDVVEFRFNV
ncbi:redox-regulated ATPase YchF [Candidatus Saccharibacteria bacterium]|nr:redox-regulated ATPase YchF [Candidatus Saccharibacteria bacterium]